MIDVSNIEDLRTLEHWLTSKPASWSIEIASRAALRVLPIYWEWTIESPLARQEFALQMLPIRSTIISSIVARAPTERLVSIMSATAAETEDRISKFPGISEGPVKSAARAAGSAAAAVAAADPQRITFATNAAAAAAAAASSVRAAIGAAGSVSGLVWSVVKQDCYRLSMGGDLMSVPLWGDYRNPLSRSWAIFKEKLHPEMWAFWVAWYDAELEGKQKWPETLIEISNVDITEWGKGVENLNSIIRTIFPDISISDIVEPDQGKNDLENQEAMLGSFDKWYKTVDDGIQNLSDTVTKQREIVGKHEVELNMLETSAKEAHSRIEGWMEDIEARFEAKVNAAKEALEQQAVFKEPIKLWELKETEHKDRKKRAYRWFLGSLIALGSSVTIGFSIIFSHPNLLLNFSRIPGCNTKDPKINCSLGSIFEYFPIFVVLTLVTLSLWAIRLKMKEFLSERHLELDARERRAFAEAYIGLVAVGDAGEEVNDQRAIVYASLFRPSTDGMVKDEGGLDPSIGAAISKLLSR